MPIRNSKEQLLEVGANYTSPADFKAKNLSKYLLAKKQRLLPILFPPTVKITTAIKGIYYLYKGNKVVYIGHATLDILDAIKYHQESYMDFDNYRYYQIRSDSDIAIMSLYLSNKYRPRYNTNLGREKLTITISNLFAVLGPLIKAELPS